MENFSFCYDGYILSDDLRENYSGICDIVRYDLLYDFDYNMAKKWASVNFMNMTSFNFF